MIKGLYRSASGMMPSIKKQEAIANNISNATSSGYKKDNVFTKELSRAQRKHIPKMSDWEQPMVDDLFTDFSAGTFEKTGNPLDLAIDGDGFFQVELPDGNTALTRSGSFTVNQDGLLAHADGPILLADGGAIEPGQGDITISPNGQIDVNGAVVGRITPVTVDDLEQLEKIGASLFKVPEGMQLNTVTTSGIRQGYLETSNVDIVKQMIDRIISYREYEANARALTTQDRSLDNLFSRVASKG